MKNKRLCLNNNVYLVEGAVKDCIYNLNSCKLYEVSKDTTKYIREKIEDEYSEDDIKVQVLLQEGILSSEGNISELMTIEPPELDFVWLEITQKCNFRCVHCYEGEKVQRHMELKHIKQVIDELKELGVRKFQIIGGEPLLHPDIETVLSYCVNKFESFSIFTNASVLNANLIELLKELNATVYVSLHSDMETEFDKVTQTKGKLQQVLSNIEWMRSEGLSPVIKKVKMKGVHISPEYESMYQSMFGFPILVGDANIHQYDDEMLEKKMITHVAFEHMLEPKSVLVNMEYQSCFSRKAYIDVNLDVYPCILERRISHGNIKRNMLRTLYSDAIQKMNKDHVEGCKMCEYRYACNTCFPDTMSEKVDAKPWFCSYLPEEGRWMSKEEFIERINNRDK